VHEKEEMEEAGRACTALWEGRILEKDQATIHPKP